MIELDDHVEPNQVMDSILFVLALVSLVLNLIITSTTLTRKFKSWAIDTTLIFLVSIFDTVSAMFLIVSQIAKWATAYEIVKSNSMWCYSSAIVFCATALITIGLTALLSLVRYLAIVKNKRLSNQLFTWIAVVIILSGWIIFGFASAEHLFVKDLEANIKVSSSGIYCIPLPKTIVGKSLVGVFSFLIILPPLFIIPICYGKVIAQYNKILLDSHLELNDCSSSEGNYTKFNGLNFDRRYRYKITILVLIILAYAITSLPEILVAMAEGFLRINQRDYKRSSLLDGIVITLLFSVTIVNATFVLLLHGETLKELKMNINWFAAQINILK